MLVKHLKFKYVKFIINMLISCSVNILNFILLTYLIFLITVPTGQVGTLY
jgi:hypothetical protein